MDYEDFSYIMGVEDMTELMGVFLNMPAPPKEYEVFAPQIILRKYEDGTEGWLYSVSVLEGVGDVTFTEGTLEELRDEMVRFLNLRGVGNIDS